MTRATTPEDILKKMVPLYIDVNRSKDPRGYNSQLKKFQWRVENWAGQDIKQDADRLARALDRLLKSR